MSEEPTCPDGDTRLINDMDYSAGTDAEGTVLPACYDLSAVRKGLGATG